MDRKIIKTNNSEIYDKFTMLNFFPEVMLTDVKVSQISKIINNINKNEKTVDFEIVGNKILLKKKKDMRFDIYLKQ